MAIITEGPHRARAIDFGLGELENENRTPFIGVLFKISEGEQDADRTITWQGFLTEASAQYTIAALRRCGWQGNDLSDFESSQLYPCDEALPSEVSLAIEHEENNGKTFAKVSFVNSPERTQVKIKNPIEGRAAKQFGARFKSLCTSIPAFAGQSTQRNPARTQSTPPNNRRLPPSDTNGDTDEFPY